MNRTPHPFPLPQWGEGVRRTGEGEPRQFMVPMHVEKSRKGTFHEPSRRAGYSWSGPPGKGRGIRQRVRKVGSRLSNQ